MKHTLNALLVAAAFMGAVSIGLPSVASAHRAEGNHTHCSKGGKGWKAPGATDSARKKACVTAKGVWDERKPRSIEDTTAAEKIADPGEGIPK